jgi:ectoine hydroxylase-related dioxygenase (phytanoyl-CoA dioxygenase family)
VKEGVVYAHAPANALSRVLALRIHLDDSTERNGPLRVLPGSHERGVMTDEEIERLVPQTSPLGVRRPKRRCSGDASASRSFVVKIA